MYRDFPVETGFHGIPPKGNGACETHSIIQRRKQINYPDARTSPFPLRNEDTATPRWCPTESKPGGCSGTRSTIWEKVAEVNKKKMEGKKKKKSDNFKKNFKRVPPNTNHSSKLYYRDSLSNNDGPKCCLITMGL